MKTLISMGVLFAIIFLASSLSMALAEKENMTIQNNYMVMRNNTTMPNTMSMPMNQIGLPNGAATNVTTNVIIQNVTFNLITFMNISLQGPVQAPNLKGLSENQSDQTMSNAYLERGS